MTERDDHILIDRCRKGERGAFEELVGQFQDVVYRTGYRLLGSHDEAEDVAQTVFMRIAQKLGDYNPKYKLFSWIYKIAVNEALNRRRDGTRNEPLDEVRVAGEAAADEQYIRNETTAGIQNALMKLTEEQRTVVVLRHFEDLSYGEIAGVLGIPEKTVKSRLFSARQQLRSLLLPTVNS
jgi:RNA polymerase sigma-70 factor (ECF subfamily)